MQDRPQVADGTVRSWDVGEGWGVIDSPAAPGGCWASFAVVEMPGFKQLRAGQRVRFEFDALELDGYPFTARRVEPLPD
ncbi:cold-shock protein [Pimelobacter simplex]|uniref:cold-shock protein n=1 Tax=Nocardioides simplex TaxID=2045 RepID=UPI003AACC216